MVNKIKLWPSRTGLLHGVKNAENLDAFIRITTHCGMVVMARASRRSRAARWLRNRWIRQACTSCGIPDWKIKRFTKGRPTTQRLQRHEVS
jgi:pyrrolysyl-tRNA synthetase-like protein